MATATRLLTHSSVAAFKACERRYQFRYELGLEPARDKQALRLGDRFHAGLDEIFTTLDMNSAALRVSEMYRNIPAWVTDLEAWDVERETCLALLAGWYARYVDPKADLSYEVLGSELLFELPLRNPVTGRSTPRWRRAGKIDRVLRENSGGRVVIMEHKTTSETITPDSDYLMRLRIDPQVSQYLTAARELGFKVEGIVYDIIRKPSIRPKAPTKIDLTALYSTGRYCGVELSPDELARASSDRETAAMFGARLVSDMAERPEFYFTRIEVARLEDDLTRFALESWQTQQRIAQASRSRVFLSNPSACLLPYRCAYADLCFAGIHPEAISTPPDGYRYAPNPHSELEIA